MIQNTTLDAWPLPACLFPVLLLYLLVHLSDNIHHLAFYTESYLFPLNPEAKNSEPHQKKQSGRCQLHLFCLVQSSRDSLFCTLSTICPSSTCWNLAPSLQWNQHWGMSDTHELEAVPSCKAWPPMLSRQAWNGTLPSSSSNSQSLPTRRTQAAFTPGHRWTLQSLKATSHTIM